MHINLLIKKVQNIVGNKGKVAAHEIQSLKSYLISINFFKYNNAVFNSKYHNGHSFIKYIDNMDYWCPIIEKSINYVESNWVNSGYAIFTFNKNDVNKFFRKEKLKRINEYT